MKMNNIDTFKKQILQEKSTYTEKLLYKKFLTELSTEKGMNGDFDKLQFSLACLGIMVSTGIYSIEKNKAYIYYNGQTDNLIEEFKHIFVNDLKKFFPGIEEIEFLLVDEIVKSKNEEIENIDF